MAPASRTSRIEYTFWSPPASSGFRAHAPPSPAGARSGDTPGPAIGCYAARTMRTLLVEGTEGGGTLSECG